MPSSNLALVNDFHFPEELVTVRQLADALGVTVQGVHHHIRAGHIPVIKSRAPGTDVFVYLIARKDAERIVARYRRDKSWTD